MRFEALKVGELARRTGLTVRTLHHYDEIGLLKPSLHTESGHRLYTAGDVARLQQVISLRQLGFSLEEVRDCLDRPGLLAAGGDRPPRRPPAGTDRVAAETVRAARSDRRPASARRGRSPPRVPPNDRGDDHDREALHARADEAVRGSGQAGRSRGDRAIEEAWTALLAEVRANRDLDPASPQAQALARRWDELTERTMRGYQAFPELKQAIAENYKQGRFEGLAPRPQAADFAFIERVKAARQAHSVIGPLV